MAQYRIVDDRIVDGWAWLLSYNTATGLVTGTTTEPLSSLTFPNAAQRDAAIALINGNSSNTFIGHVPKKPYA